MSGLADLDQLYGLDGQDGMGELYETFDMHRNFAGATITDSLIRPAGTVAYINGAGVNIIRTEFQDMNADDPALLLGTTGTLNAANVSPTRYTDVSFNGSGSLDINNAIVYGLSTNGNITINLQSGYLNEWEAGADTNVILRTQQGANLQRIALNGASFDERSSLNGAFIRGGEILNTIFRNIDARGAQFSDGLHIGGGEISGDFSGCRFSNMSLACDPRSMKISESTSFQDVKMFNPQTGLYQRVDDRGQFEAIGQAYAITESVREVLPQMNWAQEQELAALRNPQPAVELTPALSIDGAVAAINSNGASTAAGTEFSKTSTTALLAQTVNATPIPSATEPARIVSGGDAPANETPAQMVARLGGALTENFGQPVVSANQNDVRVLENNTAEARAARMEIAAARTEMVMSRDA